MGENTTAEFKLPEIGEGVHEGEIVKWLVKPGDAVSEDQALVEIMTDKATVEVPTSQAGTIQELLVAEGAIIKVGQVIAKIATGAGASASPQKTQTAAPEAPQAKTEQNAQTGEKTRPNQNTQAKQDTQATHDKSLEAEATEDEGGEASVGPDPTSDQSKGSKQSSATVAAKPQSKAPVQDRTTYSEERPQAPQYAAGASQHSVGSGSQTYTASPGNVLASPATRRLARELQVPLEQITGSGPAGRVTREDVQRTASTGMGATSAGPQRIAPSAPRGNQNMPAATSNQTPSRAPNNAMTAPALRNSPTELETLVPFRGMRRKIAEGMRHSKDTAAHFTYVDECDVSELVKFRADAKKMAEEQGVKLTYLPFLIKAAIQALKKYPMLNSSLDEAAGNIIVKNYFNIGIAMDTPDGLIVPVVKDCANKSILQIAHEISVLSEKAQNKRLTVEDFKGGTFTITNAGTIGGLFATPIINSPEVAILGFNKIAKRPHVRKNAQGEDELFIADMTWFSISIDHRIVDGATGARFMNEFMGFLANPKRLILDMI